MSIDSGIYKVSDMQVTDGKNHFDSYDWSLNPGKVQVVDVDHKTAQHKRHDLQWSSGKPPQRKVYTTRCQSHAAATNVFGKRQVMQKAFRNLAVICFAISTLLLFAIAAVLAL